jgi:hypothetical protein
MKALFYADPIVISIKFTILINLKYLMINFVAIYSAFQIQFIITLSYSKGHRLFTDLVSNIPSEHFVFRL